MVKCVNGVGETTFQCVLVHFRGLESFGLKAPKGVRIVYTTVKYSKTKLYFIYYIYFYNILFIFKVTTNNNNKYMFIDYYKYYN